MPAKPEQTSTTEAQLQRSLHQALTRSRNVLVDCPAVSDLDDVSPVDALEERVDELAASIAEAACLAAEMRALHLTCEGAMVVGAADVAIAALRTTLASLVAALDVARDDAA